MRRESSGNIKLINFESLSYEEILESIDSLLAKFDLELVLHDNDDDSCAFMVSVGPR